MGEFFGFGGSYSVQPFDNVVSGVTHSISGFASLYIMISNIVSMKKRNIKITVGILIGFCVAAYIANIFVDCNYMFLTRGDGTPYDIVYGWVNGNMIAYPMLVVAMSVVYLIAFYIGYDCLINRITN